MLKNGFHIDVLLIVSMKEELDIILEAEADWQAQNDSEGFLFYTRNANVNTKNEISVALVRPVDAKSGFFDSNIVSRLVNQTEPRCVSMAGICAGQRGKAVLGDVVIADRVFRYDTRKIKAFQEGKVAREETFCDIQSYHINPLWIKKARIFPSDWADTIKTENPRAFMPGDEKPRVHIAAMGTGEHTKENPEVFPATASHVRKVLTIDSGAFAIGAVAEIENVDACIIVKAVADHINSEKDDPFRLYAIEASYRFLMAFLKDNLPQPRYHLNIPINADMRYGRSETFCNSCVAFGA
jgi:nucleoside phosphorylase